MTLGQWHVVDGTDLSCRRLPWRPVRSWRSMFYPPVDRRCHDGQQPVRMCAAAIPVISAWSYAGATSTMSAEMTCRPARPRMTPSSSRLVIPARLGRSCRRRVGGIEDVDVDGYVHRPTEYRGARACSATTPATWSSSSSTTVVVWKPSRCVVGESDTVVQRAADADVHAVAPCRMKRPRPPTRAGTSVPWVYGSPKYVSQVSRWASKWRN